MKNKIKPIQIGLLFLAALLICSILLVTKVVNFNKIVDEKNKFSAKNFTSENINYLLLDTFKVQLRKAYKDNISFKSGNNILELQLKDAQAVTKDFFNGNDALLKYKLSDWGFEISYNENKKEVYALFSVKNNKVAVPNDVIIKMVDKANNQN